MEKPQERFGDTAGQWRRIPTHQAISQPVAVDGLNVYNIVGLEGVQESTKLSRSESLGRIVGVLAFSQSWLNKRS